MKRQLRLRSDYGALATSSDSVAPGISRKTSQKLNGLTPLFIFILALIPRIATIGRYVTPDEPIWVYRALGLRKALLSADWSSTIQSGHPGVTTTWIGALAAQINLWLNPELRENLQWLEKLYWLTPENEAEQGRANQNHEDHGADPGRLVNNSTQGFK